MSVLPVLMVELMFGIICAYIHKGKRRSTLIGFLMGFFLSIIGLIIVLVETDKNGMDINRKTFNFTFKLDGYDCWNDSCNSSNDCIFKMI